MPFLKIDVIIREKSHKTNKVNPSKTRELSTSLAEANKAEEREREPLSTKEANK